MDDLPDTAGLDFGAIRPRIPTVMSLTFLPSRHGSGCRDIIAGYSSQHEPNGWTAACYGDLHGSIAHDVFHREG